jgi:regulator of CtrA degradation
MIAEDAQTLTRTVIDSLHVEAMVLADEARFYFESDGLAQRSKLSPMDRVIFSCESLKVTTRLMHSVAWLIGQRSLELGRSRPALGKAAKSDPVALSRLPFDAQHIIAASEELYHRIARLDEQLHTVAGNSASPVQSMHESLARAF